MKILQIDMPNGTRWSVPAEIVADMYAKFRVKRNVDAARITYDSAFAIGMCDMSHLLAFVDLLVDWSDLSGYATLIYVPQELPDYEKLWVDAKIKMVDLSQSTAQGVKTKVKGMP